MEEVRLGDGGHVRKVIVRYTNPGNAPGERSTPKVTTRPIHKISVLVPVGYTFEDVKEQAETSLGWPAPPP
jgi:hypothetical protein